MASGDITTVRVALDRYKDIDVSFDSSRECRLLEVRGTRLSRECRARWLHRLLPALL